MIHSKLKLTLTIIFLWVAGFYACTQEKESAEFSKNWSFRLSDADASYQQIEKSSDWRTVNIPHDWSVEFPFDSINGEGCTGYLPGGTGWYKKSFTLNLDPTQEAYIYFDGVYNHSQCWLNGQKLGYHPYGYTPFYYNITPFVKGQNELVVKVDRTRTADSRWYTGSGIYRDVKLIVKDRLQVPVWGTFITTPKVSKEKAEVNIEVKVANEYDQIQGFDIVAELINADGKSIQIVIKKDIQQNLGLKKYDLTFEVDYPELWDIDRPYLYKMKTSLIKDGKTIDVSRDQFGIRSFRFDAEQGFFLNGQNRKIKGVCIHHDGGLVGAAVPKEVWKRRLETLREAGCNAIRSAHNPASEEFLELCDEMGFLVQDEFFDEWVYPKDKRENCWEQHDDYASRGYAEQFNEYAEQDLKSTILAYRNHPCIFQWSIGNEIEWTFNSNRFSTGFFDMNWDGNYFWSQPPYSPEKIKKEYERLSKNEVKVEKVARKLAGWTRELDTTRPVIANCILPSLSMANGYADALDVVGFSYRRVMYDYAKEHYPGKVVMGTENVPQWHEWKAVAERPFVAGLFLWTGIDHMGEVNGDWPRKTGPAGLIDQAGFKKPVYHMYKSLWNDEPHIAIYSEDVKESRYKLTNEGNVVEREPGSWQHQLWFWPDLNEHWNYESGQQVFVEILSNCEEIELFQNNQSLGVKKLADFDDHIYRWVVKFEEGELYAEGVHNGQKVMQMIKTAKKPVAVRVEIDQKKLKADDKGVAHVVCQLIDEDGVEVKHTDRKLHFEVDDLLRTLGVDNGNPANTQTYQSKEIMTSNGRALLIVQAKEQVGEAFIEVSGEGLAAERQSIELVNN